jgi:hypothetical protein
MPPPPPAYTDVYPAEHAHGYGSRIGFGLMVGGGYQDFTNQTLKNTTNAGGSWDARFVLGLKSVVALELAYVGTTQQIAPLGTSTASYLTSNGGEGALRINIPIIRGQMLIEPFGFVGIGGARYSISHYNQAVLSDFTSTDTVMTVPVGGGFAFATRALLLDVRGSWVPTYYDNILPGTSGALNHWGVGGNIGVMF